MHSDYNRFLSAFIDFSAQSMVRAHSIHGTRAIEFTNAIFIQFKTVFEEKREIF